MQKIFITGNLAEAIKARRDQCAQLFALVTKALKNAPAGSLKVIKCRGHLQFYHRKSKNDRQGTYIQKRNYTLASRLAQKDYNTKAAAILSKQLKSLNAALSSFNENNENDLLKLFEAYPSQLRSMITPAALSPQQFSQQWKELPYKGLPNENPMSNLFTHGGEHVRSKSELMIANALFDAHVPYRYEFPLPIKGHSDFHPDFFCLNPASGREIVWEHFGLMDDPDYAANAISKIALYAENGYIPGRNFIYTMESNSCPLSTKLVDKIIAANFAG